MPDKPRIFWGTPERDCHGNALGYGTHNSMMLRHTLPLIENTPDADVVLQIVSADKFVPVEGKINVLFTMWEFLDVPKSYQESLAKADYVIVPCGFCRDIFKPFCKHTPIVCWEGVDPDMYQFKERTAAEKFRFLWVGAPNPRKGYQSILQVVEIAERFPAVEFYLKTTVKKITDEELSEAVKKHWSKIVDIEDGPEKVERIKSRIPSPFNAEKVFTYGKNNNIFVDTRKLPVDELVGLYNDSHAFLFPSLGEGWGLTLTEAMATGLPCISIDKTGCAEYFDNSVGFVIKSDVKSIGPLPNYGLEDCRAYVPDTQSLLDAMILCCNRYQDALKKGRKASDWIRNNVTWEKAGVRLANILTEITEREISPCGT